MRSSPSAVAGSSSQRLPATAETKWSRPRRGRDPEPVGRREAVLIANLRATVPKMRARTPALPGGALPIPRVAMRSSPSAEPAGRREAVLIASLRATVPKMRAGTPNATCLAAVPQRIPQEKSRRDACATSAAPAIYTVLGGHARAPRGGEIGASPDSGIRVDGYSVFDAKLAHEGESCARRNAKCVSGSSPAPPEPAIWFLFSLSRVSRVS
jgi:hypothetical protein